MEEELWRQCVRWLIDVGVLPRQHKTTYQHAQIFDLAQTLRDGVVLCNLLNVIKPGAINVGSINIRPQMLQFLCIENLRTVIRALQNVFGLTHELFLPHDLYNMTNFRQVLQVLSSLSHSPFALGRFRPFPDKNQRLISQRDDEEIYNNLPDLASERELVDEQNLYDSVPEEEKEEGIYGTIVGTKKTQIALTDKRSYCVNEIVETERNYVKHLDMLQHKFIDRLRMFLEEKDIKKIFSNLEQLVPIHREFFKSIENAANNNVSKLSRPFLQFKDQFLKYGVYCSKLQEAVSHLDNLMKNDNIRAQVEELQNNAGPNKFKLRELLYVSMQRVLKYHLLVKELNKNTSDSHVDKVDLGKALEGVQELSHYINEVKRDSEMLQTISKVESCLVDYTVQLPLYTYGRLLKDGELKIKSSSDNKSKQRFTYLFDQALFITSIKNETYKLKDLVRLEDYVLEEIAQTRAARWGWNWTLRDKHGTHVYTLYAKTKSDKTKWLDRIKSAFEIINPSSLKGKNHSFRMKTFNEPIYCSHCKKLLLGNFFQGYYCERSNKACHSWCLAETWKSISETMTDSGSPGPSKSPHGASGNGLSFPMYRAHRDYNGRPLPPFETSSSFIIFSVGEQIIVEEQKTSDWWLGRTMSWYERKGYFPASYVSPMTPSVGANRSSRASVNGSNNLYDVAKPMLSTPIQLEQYYWYAGTLERLEAEVFLKGKPTGTFLVRTRGDQLAISLVFNNDVKHIRIHQSQNMFHVAECKNFKSVQELIRYYQENLMNTSFLGLDTRLMYPYRDPRFFPDAPHISNMHRHSLPVNKMLGHHLPPPLSRIQSQPAVLRHEANGGTGHVVSANGKTFRVLGQGLVLYDFEPRSTQELGLKANQLVNIINKAGDEHGWWKGEFKGKVGYFPSSFIQEMKLDFGKASIR